MKKTTKIISFLAISLSSLILASCEFSPTAIPAEKIAGDTTQVDTPTSPGGMTEIGAPRLVEGRVIKLGDKTIRIAANKEEVNLEISTSTVIWDDITWVAEIPTAKGAFVTAWGVWNPDRSFAVQKLYVNIVNLQGKASNIVPGDKSASFDITDQYQKSDHIVVSPLTEIYEGSTGAKFSNQENPTLLQNEQDVEVIGRRLEDGSVLAVNITLR